MEEERKTEHDHVEGYALTTEKDGTAWTTDRSYSPLERSLYGSPSLDQLPYNILHRIASYLPFTSDICSLARTSKGLQLPLEQVLYHTLTLRHIPPIPPLSPIWTDKLPHGTSDSRIGTISPFSFFYAISDHPLRKGFVREFKVVLDRHTEKDAPEVLGMLSGLNRLEVSVKRTPGLWGWNPSSAVEGVYTAVLDNQGSGSSLIELDIPINQNSSGTLISVLQKCPQLRTLKLHCVDHPTILLDPSQSTYPPISTAQQLRLPELQDLQVEDLHLGMYSYIEMISSRARHLHGVRLKISSGVLSVMDQKKELVKQIEEDFGARVERKHISIEWA